MTRMAVIFIVVCTLLGALFFVWKSAADDQAEEAAEREKRINAKGAVVFAIRDIAQGETITADAIELREIAQSKIPSDACGEISGKAGKKARYGLVRGQIMAYHDLDPYPPGYMKQLLKAVKEIPAGAVIKADAVQVIELHKVSRSRFLDLARSSTPIGKKTRKKILPGWILQVSDIEP